MSFLNKVFPTAGPLRPSAGALTRFPPDEQEGFDTYLISESSLFVYDDRVVILTCGTTLLLKTLPVIVQAGADIGLEVRQ